MPQKSKGLQIKESFEIYPTVVFQSVLNEFVEVEFSVLFSFGIQNTIRIEKSNNYWSLSCCKLLKTQI